MMLKIPFAFKLLTELFEQKLNKRERERERARERETERQRDRETERDDTHTHTNTPPTNEHISAIQHRPYPAGCCLVCVEHLTELIEEYPL